jgi:PiT family inorganic phosphate transporter
MADVAWPTAFTATSMRRARRLRRSCRSSCCSWRLLIALGFEFVNGFHDTANAVATVIYTRSMPANSRSCGRACFNLLGVLWSSGAVAFGIISLLPVELILQVGSSAGFAMVFALLIAAIIWNLGTWSFGLPASSSHTLIGSVIGVGVTNALLHGRSGTSGVDWTQATSIGKALLFSPLFGFALAAMLLLVVKFVIPSKRCSPSRRAISRRRPGSAASWS